MRRGRGPPSESRKTFAAKKRVLGNAHSSTQSTALNLALALRMQGKHAEAETLVQQTYQVHKDV